MPRHENHLGTGHRVTFDHLRCPRPREESNPEHSAPGRRCVNTARREQNPIPGPDVYLTAQGIPGFPRVARLHIHKYYTKHVMNVNLKMQKIEIWLLYCQSPAAHCPYRSSGVSSQLAGIDKGKSTICNLSIFDNQFIKWIRLRCL